MHLLEHLGCLSTECYCSALYSLAVALYRTTVGATVGSGGDVEGLGWLLSGTVMMPQTSGIWSGHLRRFRRPSVLRVDSNADFLDEMCGAAILTCGNSIGGNTRSP